MFLRGEVNKAGHVLSTEEWVIPTAFTHVYLESEPQLLFLSHMHVFT